MKRSLFIAVAFGMVAAPCSAWSCGGPAAMSVAVSCDGAKCTVTDIGHAPLSVTFGAWGTTYSLSLSPGQSGTPASSGWLNIPMRGYQSCTATVIPSR
jgi:hypothetical protein